MRVKIIKRFPDISKPGFSWEKWNSQFFTNNVILNGHYSNISYPTHWTTFSIKCAFGGTEFYKTSKVKYGVDNKTYLILNDGTMYDSLINSENKVESFTINFSRSFVSDVFVSLSGSNEEQLDSPANEKPAPNFFEQLHAHDDFTIGMLNNIRILIHEGNSDENLINELLHVFLERMVHIHSSSLVKAGNLNAVKYSTRMEILRRLNYAKDYIYSNYSEKIDLDTLAKVACLSPHHFLRSFKNAFGQTPHNFLTTRRIESAKELLINSGKSITEICQLVGFESLSSFGVLFKKHHGMAPERFRTCNQKKQISNNNL
ncbi:MAG TPA: AraC family transcriptional regulator [Ignavibacteria bacterium]|jgi:AraC-like DNA-binding protein